MTLFKQIMIAVITFGIMIFMAVGYLNFKSLNGYINDQLGENARHTANSLGLALKPIIDPDDMSLAQTMINSMFDSGRYKLIKLEDVDGKVLIENSQQTVVKDIPEWFYKIAKFEAPIADSEIMTGWAKFGTLYVQGSTALAYNELYTNSKNIFNFLLLMIIVTLVVAYFALKAIFRPLMKVQDQAEAILDNKFIIQKRIPFTADLKKMVLAMNSMVSKVKDIFEREAATLSKYQELLYKDTMSGANNRRFFQTKFSEYLASEEYSSGVTLLVSFKDLINLKSTLGFEKWQSVVMKIAQILQEKSIHNDKNAIVARLNDNDFIVLSYGRNSSNFLALCDEIMNEFKKLYANFALNDSEYPVNAAIVEYSPNTDIKTLLTSADVTLASSRLAGSFTYKVFNENQNTLVIGKEKYKELIFDSIKEDEFKSGIEKGEFLEWAQVHKNYYGTSLKPVLAALEAGKIVIFDIDVQGFHIALEKFKSYITSVFITTANKKELKKRLKNRGTDSDETIENRLMNAVGEMEHILEYDYFLVNDDIEKSYKGLKSILRAMRLKSTKIDLRRVIDEWIDC